MKKTIIIALVCAVVSAGLAYLFLSDLEIKYKSMTEPRKVIVACKRIPQGVLIQHDMLAEKIIPKEYIQPKAFQDLTKLFTEDGSAVYISLNTIEENEQVLSTKVSKTNQDTGISNLIPDGKKALSISFDSESLDVLAPGSRIDIFSIIEYTDSSKEMQDAVFCVAQNVLVLAVSGNYIGSCKKVEQDDSVNNLNFVTVAVSIDEIQKILMFCQKGSLKYVIRPIDDSEIFNIQPLKLSSLIKDISPQVSSNYNKSFKTADQKEILDIINRYTNINKSK
ncbi:MAG: Flp pilus assembly protein CpaB [Endomicrobium sp.]|jgi:pilus assembly protein CpaB|nr:Flp pilus assembly protein CpaB [Endomicrobium sp.]